MEMGYEGRGEGLLNSMIDKGDKKECDCFQM